jgi:hypothetical protein
MGYDHRLHECDVICVRCDLDCTRHESTLMHAMLASEVCVCVDGCYACTPPICDLQLQVHNTNPVKQSGSKHFGKYEEGNLMHFEEFQVGSSGSPSCSVFAINRYSLLSSKRRRPDRFQ